MVLDWNETIRVDLAGVEDTPVTSTMLVLADILLAGLMRTHGSTYRALIPAGMPRSRPWLASL